MVPTKRVYFVHVTRIFIHTIQKYVSTTTIKTYRKRNKVRGSNSPKTRNVKTKINCVKTKVKENRRKLNKCKANVKAIYMHSYQEQSVSKFAHRKRKRVAKIKIEWGNFSGNINYPFHPFEPLYRLSSIHISMDG